MKILEHGDHTLQDYKDARDAGITVCYRMPGIDVESIDYDGPPAFILWDTDRTMMAVPYEAMAVRRARAAALMGLDSPRVIFSTASRIWTNIWMAVEDNGGKFIAPPVDKLMGMQDYKDLAEGIKPDILHGSEQILTKLTNKSNIDVSNVSAVFITGGCNDIRGNKISNIATALKVPVTVIFHLPVCGLVSSTDGQTFADDLVGSLDKDIAISIDNKRMLSVNSYLANDVLVHRDGAWVPVGAGAYYPTPFKAHFDMGELYLDKRVAA